MLTNIRNKPQTTLLVSSYKSALSGHINGGITIRHYTNVCSGGHYRSAKNSTCYRKTPYFASL